MQRFILIENIEEPILVELKRNLINKKYIAFNRSNLENFLPKNLFKKLVKKGLYSSEKAKNSIKDNLFSLQRLVACLYKNITSLEIHHIDKNKFNNTITNLLSISKKEHEELDGLPVEEGIAESYKMQSKQIKNSRNTLAKNYELVLKILKLRGL